MKWYGVTVAALVSLSLTAGAQGTATAGAGMSRSSSGALQVYFIDVEGGQSTLFVGPDGESLLVDAGWPGFNSRDADRIAAAAKAAGVTKIDNLVITHYHTDHVGGVPQLVAKIPVGRFIDHGVNREDEKATVAVWNAYQKVLADSHSEHLVVKPGDILPLKSFRAEVVSADGELIPKPLPGAGEKNEACDASPMKALENTENDRSVGLMVTFGRLRIVDLGDLTWGEERPLMCPADRLGKVDILIVSHHGILNSSSPALVRAVAPRVAIMDNGAHKGASPTTFETIEGSSRLKDLWQLHTAEGSDAKHNTAESRIANLPGPDAGNYLKLTAREDGTISVTNSRTSETVEYSAK